MKTRYYKVFLFLAILFMLKINYSIAQIYSPSMVSSYCAMNDPANNDVTYPLKPSKTEEHYMRIIIVYVMFNKETFDETNSTWPANTTNGPSYKGTMLAQNKNDIPDWWNAYDPDNQSISSWFCENSCGQTHVIGDEFFVKLPLSAQEYIDDYAYQKDRENAINAYIYEYLTNHYLIQWPLYDKWKYSGNSVMSYEPDGNIDMIYKVHRYNYHDPDPNKEIFSAGALSGIAILGYGRSNTSLYDKDYIITQNYLDYHFIGAPYILKSEGTAVGSGVTIVGNETSGILDKMNLLGRLMHENGHYFFNGVHGYVGMMGDVWDLSYSPWEKIALGYITPTVSNYISNGSEEVILDDISARNPNGKYILKVLTPDGNEFLIASRYKISRWDRPMQGDVAHYNTDAPGGQGVYIYHNTFYAYNYNNIGIDIECADGLWNWVRNGYDAPDWDNNNVFLCVDLPPIFSTHRRA